MQQEFEDSTGSPFQETVQTQEVETQETEQEYTQELPEEKEESPQDRNWREMRETLKELKKQNEELSQKVVQRNQPNPYEYQNQWQQQVQQQFPKEEEENIDDDDLITAAQAKKMASKWARQEVEKYLKQQEHQNVPQKLQQQYGDYAQVVTQDNIQKLIQEDPETAEDIEALKSDPIRMSRLLYKTLKSRYSSKTHEEDPFVMSKKKEAQERQERAPASSSAVPKRSALAEANAFAQGLTPELKKQLLREMDESAKRY